mgnify:FL=1
METDGVDPDTKTYNAIIEGFCSNLELDKAEALLERMLTCDNKQKPSTVSFNTILKACGELVCDEVYLAQGIDFKLSRSASLTSHQSEI